MYLNLEPKSDPYRCFEAARYYQNRTEPSHARLKNILYFQTNFGPIGRLFYLAALAKRNHPKQPVYYETTGGSSYGAHIPEDQIRQIFNRLINSLDLRYAIGAAHICRSGRVDVHLLFLNDDGEGRPRVKRRVSFLRRMRKKMHQLETELNRGRLAAGGYAVGVIRANGRVHFEDLFDRTKSEIARKSRTVRPARQKAPAIKAVSASMRADPTALAPGELTGAMRHMLDIRFPDLAKFEIEAARSEFLSQTAQKISRHNDIETALERSLGVATGVDPSALPTPAIEAPVTNAISADSTIAAPAVPELEKRLAAETPGEPVNVGAVDSINESPLPAPGLSSPGETVIPREETLISATLAEPPPAIAEKSTPPPIDLPATPQTPRASEPVDPTLLPSLPEAANSNRATATENLADAPSFPAPLTPPIEDIPSPSPGATDHNQPGANAEVLPDPKLPKAGEPEIQITPTETPPPSAPDTDAGPVEPTELGSEKTESAGNAPIEQTDFFGHAGRLQSEAEEKIKRERAALAKKEADERAARHADGLRILKGALTHFNHARRARLARLAQQEKAEVDEARSECRRAELLLNSVSQSQSVGQPLKSLPVPWESLAVKIFTKGLSALDEVPSNKWIPLLSKEEIAGPPEQRPALIILIRRLVARNHSTLVDKFKPTRIVDSGYAEFLGAIRAAEANERDRHIERTPRSDLEI